MRHGLIYMYTCKLNGHIYIGKTIRPNIRKKEHATKRGNSRYFSEAIKKYGHDNFVYEVLAGNIPECELNEWEKYFIWYFMSYEYGYNLTKGGDGITSEVSKSMKNSDDRRVVEYCALVVAEDDHRVDAPCYL